MTMNNKRYAVVPEKEYEEILARAAGTRLPAVPKADKKGHVPALEYIRVSIAREIITRRLAAGWTQQELAKHAGVRMETISRLESAKHKPHAATVERIDAALKRAGV